MATNHVSSALLAGAILIVFIHPAIAGASDVALTPGKLTTDGKRASQLLTAKNNGSEAILMLMVECGFLKGAELVDTGRDTSLNVDTGQTVYLKVTGNDDAGADHADCRVVGASTPSTLFKPSPPLSPDARFKPEMFLNPPPKKH